jgi:enamine deaminase RidA (YjgF/YER057c/UK114 family)
MASPTARLKELGIELPALPAAAGNYVHAVRSGRLLFLAGKGVGPYTGKIGRDVTVEQAYEYARSTGLMLLSVIANELGSLNRVTRIVKVSGFVNAIPEFTEHPKVMDGCSDLFLSVFGERGRHARTSVGAGSTPRQIPLEIEAIVEFSDEASS